MEPVARADDYENVTAELLRRSVEEMRNERDAMRLQLHRAQARIRELEAALHETQDYLAAIQSGLGWAVLRRFRETKARILRPGSAVERAYGRLTGRLARRLDRS